MRMRADQRLFLSYLALIAVVVASLSVGAQTLLRRYLMATVETDLRRELALGRHVFETRELPPDSLADLLAALSGRRVTVIAPDGRVIGESSASAGPLHQIPSHAGRPEVQDALRSGGGAAVRRSTTVGIEHLYVAARSRQGAVIRFAVPLQEIETAVREVQRGSLLVAGVALALAVLFSLGFSVAVTRPLLHIHAVARAITAGDLSRRVGRHGNDELGALAAALDGLADELQRRLGQLEGERAETQALIDSMAEGVLALGPAGELRRANPAARRMFELPADPRGMPPEAVARRPDFLRLVDRVLSGRPVSATELSRDGTTLLGTAHPLPEGGAVVVFLDVTELRRLEGVRRDFVANASHELKTPLTAIRGYSETLLDEQLPPSLRRQFAETVKANADRLQRIVDDLLDLSRIESGGWRIEPETVSLPEAADEAWAAFARAAAEREVEFRQEVDDGARRVHADGGAVRQILSNLFGNALRHTPAGGGIVLQARLSSPTADAAPDDRGGAWVEVSVRDTGSGIPSAHLDRIFERFYRVDPARSRQEGGTGLGLAIVKHLIEAHGGRVHAESEIGRGTTIRFTLPTAEDAR